MSTDDVLTLGTALVALLYAIAPICKKRGWHALFCAVALVAIAVNVLGIIMELR